MSNDKEIAISVKNISKSFVLPHEKKSNLKQVILSLGRNKSYEKQDVLKDISFDVHKGDFFGIVGRNGSGKSTLLKLLAEIYTPDSGSIQVNGKLTPFIELGVGFNPELTGRENVFLNGVLLGFTQKEIAVMYDDIVAFAELERFMDQKLKNYSSGMQVRLAFSIAIRGNADILVLDEVLAVGDANFQKKCFDYFRKLKAKHQTVILVTHDMNSVKRFCNRAMLIEDGSIVSVGSPGAVSALYAKRNSLVQQVSNESPLERNNSGGVTILSVELISSDGDSLADLRSGESLRVRISYTINDKSIKVLNVGLGLHHEMNGYVFSYNTQMDSFKMKLQSGSVELALPNLPLLSGDYSFNAVCFGDDEFNPYDLWPRAAFFSVASSKETSKYRGIVALPHTWSLKSE